MVVLVVLRPLLSLWLKPVPSGPGGFNMLQPPILMASKKNKESRLNRTYIIGFKNLRGVPSKGCDVNTSALEALEHP